MKLTASCVSGSALKYCSQFLCQSHVMWEPLSCLFRSVYWGCCVFDVLRGVGAMEIVAMDMKLRGMYIARQLSFTGVTFKIEEVLLSQSYVKMYNKAVRLVRNCSSCVGFIVLSCQLTNWNSSMKQHLNGHIIACLNQMSVNQLKLLLLWNSKWSK